MNHSQEENMLMDSLNVLAVAKEKLQGAEKKAIIAQMQTILSYFQEHQDTMAIGYSSTLGYYFHSDLSHK